MVILYKGGELEEKGGKQILNESFYIDMQVKNESQNHYLISDHRCPDDAAQSRIWNSCENVRQKVSHLTASICNERKIQCQFCKLYTEFYFPGRKFQLHSSGHFIFLNKGGKDFYSSQRQFSMPLKNIAVQKPVNDGGNNALIEIPGAYESRKEFRYDFDRDNLRSLQQFPNQQSFKDRLSINREGIPDKILNKLDNHFNVPKLKLSVPKFVFRSITNLIDRVYKKFRITQDLRDISFYQFSQFIKSFISICNITYSNRFLSYCIEHDIIPPKFHKNIDISPPFRTKTIRTDCKNLSKHIMEEAINIANKQIIELKTKFKNYCFEACLKASYDNRRCLFELLLRVRNVVAFVMNSVHMRKINQILTNIPHVCVNTENVVDLALKNTEAKVTHCEVQHSPFFYWEYRAFTLEWINLKLYTSNMDTNVNTTDPDVIDQQFRDLKRVWENFLNNVTKSKATVPEGKRIIGDWRDNWNKFLYGFRWGQNIVRGEQQLNCNLERIDQSTHIPWQKPSVTLPARAAPDAEIFLATLKVAINAEMVKSWDDFQFSVKDNLFTQELLQNFLDTHQYRVVSSDKTNRCLLMKNSDYFTLGEKFLNENNDYLLLARDPNKIILDKANSIINGIKKTNHSFRKGDLDKLIKYTFGPAKLSFVVKDHKTPDEQGNYPLRPLANVNGSSLDGLDWIFAKIVNQAIRLVDYHVWNPQQVLDVIPKINIIPIPDGYQRKIISLDVVSLYPTVPTFDAANMVFRFIKEHPEINTFGVPYPIIREIINVLINNYNIEFNGRIYKQTKGVAMGARFSCAFSIVFMHLLETIVVRDWFDKNIIANTNLIYYGRYIDDVLIIFDEKTGGDNSDIILEAFNAMHRNIKFTLEKPDEGGNLAFLDMQLYINIEKSVCTKWYMKPQHSENFIKGDEFIPENVKRNTLIERFRAVMVRSSEYHSAEEGINKLVRILIKNRHPLFKIMGALRQAYFKNNNSITTPHISANGPVYTYNWRLHKQDNFDNSTKEFEPIKSILKIPYLGEGLKKTINDVINKFGREDQIRVVYTSNPRLKFLKPKDNNRTDDDARDFCDICTHLEGGDRYHCGTRIVVYRLQCRICDQFYIGKTNKTIKERISQHFNAFKNKTQSSPLWAHESYFHAGAPPQNTNDFFDKYKIIILKKNSDYVLNNVDEADFITKLKPEINRKEEVPEWDIDQRPINV